MIAKIKAFFQNKVTKIVEGVIIALASAGLLLGGVESSSIAQIPTLALAVLTAIEAVITLVQGFFTTSE